MIQKNKKPDFLALHDSATGMLTALSDFHKNQSFEGIGGIPTSRVYSGLVNLLPTKIRQKLYTWSAEFSAYPHKKIGDIRAEEIQKWVCESYPDKKYPAIAIGSSNGALVHFSTSINIPWLPQTFLVPVHKGRSFPLNKPQETMDWGRKVGASFLENNKDWQLHHMMDPVQDRLRVKKIAYFRIKCLTLGRIYSQFIRERLEPGGKILIFDCNLTWPVMEIDKHHFFQIGGLGTISPHEYYRPGSMDGVLDKLLKGAWSPPQPTAKAPEAEWGMEKSLIDAISEFSGKNKIDQAKISFNHPQDLSGPIADLFQKWYKKNQVNSEKLLVETFNLLSPLKTIQKRSIPYWMFFNVQTARAEIEEFINKRPEFKEVYIMALSHGKRSKGYISREGWKDFMHNFEKSRLIGTDLDKYPFDLGVYSRYSRNFDKELPGNFPQFPPLQISEALELLNLTGKGKIFIS